MKYKALMLDVDGTLVTYNWDAVPTDRVAQSVIKAKEKLKVFIVTGRAHESLIPTLHKLQIRSGLVATNSGAVVLDLGTKEIIYEKYISEEEGKEIISILLHMGITIYVKDDPLRAAIDKGPYKKGDVIKKIYQLYADEEFEYEKVVEVFEKLSHLPNLTLHKTKHKDPNKYGFNITHAEATKLHGIEIIMKTAGLKREEIIGVGDGYNDFPLLAASGLKVAMGNAVPDLKAIADYVAPSVEDDGVADVIERYVLNI